MKSKLEEYDNYSIIRLDGQFVGGEETDKLFELAYSIINTDHKNLIMDFSWVVYFSSIVIGKLIRANRDFTEADGKLVICNVNKTIKDVFDITKVSSFIPIYDNVEDAVSHINN